jgi:hypothetical protein
MSSEEEEYVPDTSQKQDPATVNAIPTIDYWEKTYGKNCDGNDQKAAGFFKEYESAEKTRRFQTELILVKEKKVSVTVLNAKLGKKRGAKFDGFHNWASYMLIWLSQKKR